MPPPPDPGSEGRPSQESILESVFGIIVVASVLVWLLTRSAHLLITVASLVMPASWLLQNEVASAIEPIVSTTGLVAVVALPVAFLTVSLTVPPGSDFVLSVGSPTDGAPPVVSVVPVEPSLSLLWVEP